MCWLFLLSLLQTPFSAPQPLELVIHEVMADPTPAVGLPAVEYVELRNRSGRPLQLGGCRLQTEGAQSGRFPPFLLLPDSLLILSSTGAASALRPWGTVLSLPSFPALPNEGGLLSLLSAEGLTLHAIAYAKSWYRGTAKGEGGWSLEMVDAANPCGGSGNWEASRSPLGGTPGSINSVARANRDETPPALLRAFVPDSLTIAALFSEPLDSLRAASPLNYSVPGGPSVMAAFPLPPLFNEVRLVVASPLLPFRTYTLEANGLADCRGNELGTRRSVPFALPQPALPGEVVINEILFNPLPGGADYVEVYNRSEKAIDLRALFFAGRNPSGELTSPVALSIQPLLLLPRDYAAFTTDRDAVLRQYAVKDAEQLFLLPSLPSLPDDKGTLVLWNAGGVLEELRYSATWQFPLLPTAEGVALERVRAEGGTGQANWHSAAATAGYGTPTAPNSQLRAPPAGSGKLEVTPPVCSPNGDGHDDFVLIRFQGEPGAVANLQVFDAGGRLLRYLVQNALLGERGEWKWDGLDDRGRHLPPGVYLLQLDTFTLEGKKERVRATVVLAR
jgi:hypothetical protein